ncbi:MAG: zinc ribbon domain-containing protein [Chloroflexi bacterium]|nr:zinc ribbon domain-containing protein [Chloroflexota bacterium]MDA1220098.1 zinc ribbon domain-containing protein [Chloroflexota bacterium]
MPIYEFRCVSCGKVSSFFTRSINAALDPSCNHCQSKDMRRRMSSFATGKTARSVHGQHTPYGSQGLDYYSDPRNIGRHVEDSFKQNGMDLPHSVRNTIDAAREGDLPKRID